MKKLNQIGYGLLVLALITLGAAGAQTSDCLSSISLTPVQSSVLALSGTNVASFNAFSDDQLTSLVNTLDGVPTFSASSLPYKGIGTFWSLQNPNWPPMPIDSGGANVWLMADGSYLMNDIATPYDALSTTTLSPQAVAMDAMAATSLSATTSIGSYVTADGVTYSYQFNPGTNLWLTETNISGGNIYGIISNTVPDEQFELQYTFALAQPWQSASWFVYGSESTNWTPYIVPAISSSNLFLRVRSWIDTYNIGIPDWWQIEYFGTNGINPDASDGGDGYDNLDKFQMGLNPTNYYNPNGPPGFFGYLDATGTNVFIAWSAASGPVVNYTIQRGISNSLTGLYVYSQVGTVSSNADFIEDVGAIKNSNAWNNVYNLEALYPNSSVSGTDTWFMSWYGQYGGDGAPYGPPSPTNFYAYADTNAANVLLSWSPASDVATNYLIERGIFNAASNAYVYRQIASLGVVTNSFKVTNPFTNANNWSDSYGIVAVYPGKVGATLNPSPINVGNTNGLAAPTSFYGYADVTGTNLVLAWTPAGGTVANYVIFEGNTNSLGICAYGKLAMVNGSGTSFVVTNGFDSDSYLPYYQTFAIFAVYADGTMSQAAIWQSANYTPSPSNFVAYFDETGKNVWLSWTAVTGPVMGYSLWRIDEDSESFTYNLNSNMTSFEDTNAVNSGDFDSFGTTYYIQALYPRGGLSSSAWAIVGTLPTPGNVSATLDVTGKNVNVTWVSVGGAIGYVIQRGVLNSSTGTYAYSTIATLGASVTTYTDAGAITGANSYNNVYQVEAIFPGGVNSSFVGSAVSESSEVPLSNVYLTANLIRNGSGRWQVMFSGLPTNRPQAIQLTFADDFVDELQTNLVTTNLVGGIWQLPDAFAMNLLSYDDTFELTAELFGPSGEPGQIVQAGYFAADAPYFVDGSRHMKQNLEFLIRAASNNQLFFSAANGGSNNDYSGDGYIGQYNESSTTFEEFSFLHHSGVYSDDVSQFALEGLWPFTANYELANYLADTSRTGGIGYTDYGLTNFIFTPNFATNMPAPAILAPANAYWILQPGLPNYFNGNSAYSPPGNWGLAVNTADTTASMSAGKNLFGLSYAAGYLVGINQQNDYNYQVISPGGGNVTEESGYLIQDYASWCPEPTLLLVNYYFCPLNEFYPNALFGYGSGVQLPGELDAGNGIQPFPVPIEDDFNVTNQSAPLIASVGQPMIAAAWAKYSIQGSSPTKYAYLGQYFLTNAFLFDTNGLVTTNSAGVLSPYGEFFPLQTGMAQLTTTPDIDSPYQQGTNVIRIISMNVDANHDGTMDLSYGGPDFVSQSKPFRFWANDDQDAGDYGGNFGVPGIQPSYLQDGLSPAGDFPNPEVQRNQPVFEAFYRVHGRRDLVDYFPVYLNIGSLFQSNMLSAGINPTDTNYQFILTQADGVLRFAYTDLTPTNYMNYLLDATNESAVLSDAIAYPLNYEGIPLTQSFLGGIATNNQGIILVEAATNTTQPLVLTIYHGTNIIAQTSLALSITGVEQMFRQKNLMLNPADIAPADRLTDSSVPNEPDTIDKNFVFLHGYNVNTNEARGVASDMYKRMYWSGSHAKFWAVTWQGADSKGTPPFYDLLTPNYHTNVMNAFLTAPLLGTFIASLTNSGPVVVAAHSLGNMVVLSAISDWNAPISQYFMMDSAVPVEAIDPTAVTNFMAYSTGLNDWLPYTNRLYASYWHQLFPGNDARSTLSWNNRLGNLGSVDVYNFYSSGEEVLRTTTNDPPSSALSMTTTQLTYHFWDNLPFGTFTWYWQEKGKGTASQDWFLGSSHGGWKMNYNPPYLYISNGLPAFASPAQALSIPNSQLMTNAFFDLTSSNWGTADLALYGSSGSSYAQANRSRLLADAIPAMSVVAGANPVPSFARDHNIDMMTLENGWSLGRTGSEAGMWHHSDFVQMAYTFTHQLFDQFVTTGNLK